MSVKSHPIYELPNWWIADCELSRADPRYGSDDYLSLPYPHTYYMDVMSFFDLMSSINDDVLPEAIAPMVNWLDNNLKGHWWMCSFTTPSTDDDRKDVRIQMWFSFDLAEDAMLSRMTWTALRLRKYGHP